jgi:hypothetical protein
LNGKTRIPQQAAAASPELFPTPMAPQPGAAQPTAPDVSGNPLFAVEPGTGGGQLMDAVRMKPWIRNPTVRKQMGLPPLEQPQQ